MRLRSRRRTMVAWSSSSSGRVARHGVHVITRSTRARRIRWRVRTVVLLAIIGVLRLARTYPRPALSLAGTAVTVAGITLPSGAVLVSGFVVLFLAMFLPSDPAAATAKPCSARLWAEPLIPWASSTRHRPPYR